MERPLARRQRVGVLRVHDEQRAAILQGEAVIVHHHARTESPVHALDQRSDIALAIHHGEINRVAARRPAARPAGSRSWLCRDRSAWRARGRNPSRAGPRRAACKARVGHVALQVGIGQLLRLDLRVQFLHAARGIARPWETARTGSAFPARRCPGRWAAARRPSSRGSRWRSANPFGFELAQIGGSPSFRRAGRWSSAWPWRWRRCRMPPRPCWAISLSAAAICGIAEHLAHFRRRAVRAGKPARRSRRCASLAVVQTPRRADDLGDGIAVRRVVNGGLEEVAPGQMSEALVQFGPAIHAARGR